MLKTYGIWIFKNLLIIMFNFLKLCNGIQVSKYLFLWIKLNFLDLVASQAYLKITQLENINSWIQQS